MSLFNNSSGFLSSWSKKNRPPLEAIYIYILALFMGFLVSDLGILYVRPGMLPTQPPPSKPAKMAPPNFTNVANYIKTEKRNILNADGVIPPPLESADGGGVMDGIPVASQLPTRRVQWSSHASSSPTTQSA